MIKQHRPIDLNLMKIKFPLNAIASITHRISGIVMFVVIGVLLILLKLSLLSQEYFDHIKLMTNCFFSKFTIWCILVFIIYHCLNGFRNILMDMGCLNTTLLISKKSANVVFLLTGTLSIIIGFLLC